jgi:hypothetical protein
MWGPNPGQAMILEADNSGRAECAEFADDD